jgi:YegS/Rv2252/BmrU family lipid kinase
LESYKRIHVIVNPASGRNEPILNVLNPVFHAREVVWDVSVTLGAGDCTRYARAAAEAGVDVVAAYGGDGTISEAVSGLVGTDVPLMILPGGTNNVLAAEFGVPNKLAAAVDQLFHSKPHLADVGQVDLGPGGVRYFLMRAEIGLPAEMNVETTRELKDQLGPLAYGVGAVRALEKAERVQFTLEMDGQRVETMGVACQVLNTSRMGSATAATFARAVSPYDGLLDVIIDDTTPEGISSTLDRTFHVDEGWGKSYWQCREVTVTADPVKAMWCDGEPFGDTPKTIRVVPGAVRILTLPDTAGGSVETTEQGSG